MAEAVFEAVLHQRPAASLPYSTPSSASTAVAVVPLPLLDHLAAFASWPAYGPWFESAFEVAAASAELVQDLLE